MFSLSYGWKANFAVIVAAPFGMLLRAYTIATLWTWFLVPLGLPVLGLAHAYGIGVLAGLVATYVPALKDKDVIEVADTKRRDATPYEARLYALIKIGVMALGPAVALLFGYAAHYLMVRP